MRAAVTEEQTPEERFIKSLRMGDVIPTPHGSGTVYELHWHPDAQVGYVVVRIPASVRGYSLYRYDTGQCTIDEQFWLSALIAGRPGPSTT